jgi:hypothetical protein
MATKKKLLQAAAGSAGGEALNVEDVFSTYLYTGNDTATAIDNGVDLAGEGGLVWVKARSTAVEHVLYDTERGALKLLQSNSTAAELTQSTGLSSFNSNGFTVGTNGNINGSPHTYASWTFRKAPKFFDVVKVVGDGTGTRTINHNLNGTVGTIIIKKTSSTGDWFVSHRTQNNFVGWAKLNTTDAFSSTGSQISNVTDTSFDIGSFYNGTGVEWIIYVFAHNDGDGEFGPDGDADIIKCGSYTGNSTVGHTIDLGFEAQWVLVRSTSNLRKWMLYDAMRGMPVDGNGAALYPNSNDDEENLQRIGASNVGFQLTSTDSMVNLSGETYIYIAIRRGPMAVPTDATDVFDVEYSSQNSDGYYANLGAVTDTWLYKDKSTSSNWLMRSRLTGANYLNTNLTEAESTQSSNVFDFMDGWFYDGTSNSSKYSWMWKRAPSFCDAVAYTGNGTAGRTVSHNLGVAPEMMWVKRRNTTGAWAVYHKGLNGGTDPEDYYLTLTTNAETTGSYWNNTAPTDSVITFNGGSITNASGSTYIAYLFASLDGVSKVGSYTGSSSAQTIDCGFSSGARFVMIKNVTQRKNWMFLIQNGDSFWQ